MTLGSLDQQVEQRMDAYRGNPQQLEQRSKMSKELMDALALQKLTSEKDAAARELALTQQQNPKSVIAQREQALLDQTKKEMGSTVGELANRTAGTLGQKQAVQQKGMRALAKKAEVPAGTGGIRGLPGLNLRGGAGANPQAAGLANARMAQVAGQGGPRRMAQGGVVGFQSGEGVNLAPTPIGRTVDRVQSDISEDLALSALRQRVANKFGIKAGVIGAFTPQSDAQRAFAKNVAANIDSYTPAQLLALDRIDPSELGVNTALPFEQMASETAVRDSVRAVDSLTGRGLAQGMGPMSSPPSPVAPIADLEIPEVDAPIQTEAFKMPPTLGKSTAVGTPSPQNIGGIADAIDVFGNRGVSKRGSASGTDGGAGGGLESIMMNSAAIADKITGRKDKATRFDEMKQEALDKEAELFDPAMERSNRLTDFLVGGAGTTTLGGLAKGAVGASRATQEKQNAATMKRMADRFATEVTGMQVDAGLAGASLSLGTAVFNQAEQSKRTAQQIAANKSTAKLNAETEKIKLEHAALSDAQKIKIQDRLARVAERGADTTAAELKLREQKEAARVSELDAKTRRETQLAADKAVLKEWTEYTSFIMELSSEFLDDAREDIQNEITRLSESTTVGNKDQQTETNAQIAKLNEQLNSAGYMSGLATLKANQFISAVLGGEAFLDRYDSLVPMVQDSLNRARQAQGITGQAGLNVTDSTYRE